MRTDLKQRALSQKTIIFLKQDSSVLPSLPRGAGGQCGFGFRSLAVGRRIRATSGCLQETPLASIQGAHHWLTLQEPLWIPSLSWVLQRNLGRAVTSWRRRWSSRSPGAGGVQAACRCSTAQSPN